jgi:hypothetical protein
MKSWRLILDSVNTLHTFDFLRYQRHLLVFCDAPPPLAHFYSHFSDVPAKFFEVLLVLELEVEALVHHDVA